MVASLNPEIGVDETNALLKKYLDAHAAADEAALLNLDGCKTLGLGDPSTPSSFIARQKAVARVLTQFTDHGENHFFQDEARGLLGPHAAGAWSDERKRLLAGALREAAVYRARMQVLHTLSRYPDAPRLPDVVPKDIDFDPRVMRIMVRMRKDDCYGDVLSNDQIREFLTSGDRRTTSDGEWPVIDDGTVAAFAALRPVDTIIPVPTEAPQSSRAMSAMLMHIGLEPIARTNFTEAEGVIAQEEQAASDPFPDPFPDIPLATSAGEPLMSSVWDEFKASMLAEKRWSPATANQADATLRLIVAIVGDLKPSALGPATGQRAKATFLRLPRTYDKNPRWRLIAGESGLIAVAATFEADAANGVATDPPTTIKTWNRHVTVLNAFHQWAWGAVLNRDGKAPSLGLHVKQKVIAARNLPDSERAASIFAQEQVTKIFSNAAFTNPVRNENGEIKYPSRYFGQLFLAHTGARREEIFQLRVRNIRLATVKDQTGGERKVWYIDLNNDLGLKLKTVASRRYIPLHNTLIKLGVIEELVDGRSQDELLFRDVDELAASKGNAAGKWSLALFKKLGVHKRGNHKWRHTVVTNLKRAGVPAGHVEELVGHSGLDRDDLRGERAYESRRGRNSESEQRTYDAGLELSGLADAIEKLHYDFDFSRLLSCASG